MMARRSASAAFLTVALLALRGCFWRGGAASYRFLMVVRVATPAGLRTGSSVYEVEGRRSVDLFDGPGGSATKLRGEAVEIALPGGAAWFALLKLAEATGGRDDLAYMATKTLDPSYAGDHYESAKRIADRKGNSPPVVVPRSLDPVLVSLAERNDPSGMRLVEPGAESGTDDAGVVLKEITVEKTEMPVTLGIEKRVSWLRDFTQSLSLRPAVGGANAGSNDEVLIEIDAFSTEYRPWQ